MTASEGADTGGARDGGGEFEAVEVDKLAELKTVGEDKMCGVALGERDVGGVQRVGDLDVEPLIGPAQGWYYSCHLKDCGSVLSRWACVGVHALEELQQDSSCERRHVLADV